MHLKLEKEKQLQDKTNFCETRHPNALGSERKRIEQATRSASLPGIDFNDIIESIVGKNNPDDSSKMNYPKQSLFSPTDDLKEQIKLPRDRPLAVKFSKSSTTKELIQNNTKRLYLEGNKIPGFPVKFTKGENGWIMTELSEFQDAPRRNRSKKSSSILSFGSNLSNDELDQETHGRCQVHPPTDFIYVELLDGTHAKVKSQHLMPLEPHDWPQSRHGWGRQYTPKDTPLYQYGKHKFCEKENNLRDVAITPMSASMDSISMVPVHSHAKILCCLESSEKQSNDYVAPAPELMMKGTPLPSSFSPTVKWQPVFGKNGVIYKHEADKFESKTQRFSGDEKKTLVAPRSWLPCKMQPVDVQGSTVICNQELSPMSVLSPGDGAAKATTSQEFHPDFSYDDMQSPPPVVKNVFHALHQK